jgi:hypothetical protein
VNFVELVKLKYKRFANPVGLLKYAHCFPAIVVYVMEPDVVTVCGFVPISVVLEVKGK